MSRLYPAIPANLALRLTRLGTAFASRVTLGLAFITFVGAAQGLSAATVQTNKADYAPGETALITGSGWASGETVVLEIDHVADGIFGAGHEPWAVVADASGNVSTTWYVDPDDSLGATFLLTATGNTSGQVASTTFTDSRSIDSVTLNGGTNVTVLAGGSMTAAVTVTTDNGGGNNDWQSTRWVIATTPPAAGTGNLVNHADHTGSGTYTESFVITAPAAAGTYNAYFVAYSKDDGTQGDSSTYTLAGSVTVNAVNVPNATTTSVVSSLNPSTYGQSVTFTATVSSTATPTGGVNFVIDGGSPVAGTAGTTTGTTATWTYTTSALTAGTHTVSANYLPTGSFQSSSGSLSGGQVVNKANATFTVTPYSVTYDGQAHTATVSVITGVNGETGSTVGTVNVNNTTHTDAGTYNTDSWSFTGTANYNSIGATTITDTISKANATVVVAPYSVTFNGQPHTASVTSITGVNGETGSTVGTVDLSNTTHTNAGTYASDSWSFTGATNYNNIGATPISDSIAKANASVVVTPYTVTYDGQPHTATYTITGVGTDPTAAGSSITLNTTHTNAGTYASDTWSFSGGTNYNDIAATTIADTINKANSTFTVTPYSVTYDGQPHTATVSAITGVNGETGVTVGTVNVSNTTHTDAGTYASDSWSFTGTANYNDIASTTITDKINKANATFTVTPYSVTYDGQAHTATVSAITGVNGETGATVGTVNVNNTMHTDAGTYNTDSWSFNGTANYNSIAASTITDTINKANATVVVAPYSVTFNGQPHTASVTSIAGVNGETGATVGTVDLSNTTHTNAGTYASDSWSFTGATNYNNIGATTITDSIAKANASVVVTPYTVTYDGQPHSATSTITGVGTDPTAAGSSITLNTTHTVAGTYASDTWSFSGGINYNDIGSTTITDTINKANATFTVTPYSVTYDGQPHTATVSAITGVNGETGVTVGTVSVSNTTHTDAGTYASDSWSFTGTANYNSIAATTVTDTINKANATFTVTPYSVTYDGQPHTATVSAITGVNGETGATVGTVNVINTTHTNAATYASDTWSFSGTPNYNSIGATTITDTISKANAVVVVAPYTVTYDGQPHMASVTSITGVNGETGAAVGTVDLSNTTHTNAGTYASDSWSFTGATNYNDIASTTITDKINKANAVIVVAPYTVTYDGLPHTATVTSITGVAGQTGATVGTVNVGNTTHTDAGTYASDSWSFTGTANYNDIASTAITDKINKANAVVVVAPYTVTYDGLPHTASVTSITGVAGQTGATVGTVDLNTTTHTNAGTYNTDSWTFTGTANYNDIGATTITNTINKAGLTITASNKSKECGSLLEFDTSSPSADFSVAGLLVSDSVTGASLSSAGAAASALACPSPTYPIAVSGAAGSGLANYSITYVPGTLTVIDTTPPTISLFTVSPGGGPFAAGAQQITVNATFLESCSVKSVVFDWDDGTSSPATTLTGATASGVHTYQTAGVYSVKVTVTDGCDSSAVRLLEQYVVIYDPSAGFVTGGGWINSPAGASRDYPLAAGKANFGFSAQYKKGQSVPTGETEFQFQMGNLNFHSTAYQWLVVAGAKAQYKGTGTISGRSGVFGFLLTATDGQGSGGGVDKFRIKITDGGSVPVYDNVPLATDDIDSANPQAVGGGSIVIHSK